MKFALTLSILVLCSLQSAAHADVFGFKDLEGFEKCLETDNLVETTKTEKGAQDRALSPGDIQLRCIENAVALLGPLKNQETDLEFIGAVKRRSAHENALDLISVLVNHSLAGCNQLPAYEVVMKVLSRPKDSGKASYFSKTKSIVKRCLKDKEFQTDFLEEKDHPGADRSANACEILLEERIVKSCKKGA